MIYLNNAATSYPKPPSVISAVADTLRDMPDSSLRSSRPTGPDLLTAVRQRLGQLFHIADHERIFMASGATDAINRIIGGLCLSQVIVTNDNHNSVLRPLYNQEIPCNLTLLPTGGQSLISDALQDISMPVHTEGHTLLILPHCSNVTGAIHDVATLCQKAHEKGMLVMVDASQSAGCIPIDVDGWGIDILVFTGHKSLLGPQGTGGYYVNRSIRLRPTLFGGTGSRSDIISYPDGAWEYEPGTPNLPGIAGLKAGIDYVLERGVEKIFQQGQQQTDWLIQQMRAIPKVRLHSQGGASQGPVISLTIEGLHPSDAGYILLNSYGIVVRTGLQCSPLIHRELGTHPDGTLRVSLSCHTTKDDLQALVDALHDISDSL